ncbi:hypothetical protein JCM3765_006909 [Sporobolomyces pararoseus]
MLVGSQCTNHTAFLRSDKGVPAFDSLEDPVTHSAALMEVGLARREPLLAVFERVAEKVEQQQLRTDSSETTLAIQMSVCTFAMMFLSDLDEFAPELLHLTQRFVRRGFAFRRSSIAISGKKESFDEPFREIVRAEICISLLLSRSSVVSPVEYNLLFDLQYPPTIPTPPPDFDFVFSGPPEPPQTRKIALDFQNRWAFLARPVYFHLERVLTYATTSRLRPAIEYCWTYLEEITDCVGNCIERILADPRYLPDDPRPRPRSCVIKLILAEYDALLVLRCIHNKITQIAPALDLFKRSEFEWYRALTRTAQRLKILPLLAVQLARELCSVSPATESVPLGCAYSMGSRHTHRSRGALLSLKQEVPEFGALQASSTDAATLLTIGCARRDGILSITRKVTQRAQEMQLPLTDSLRATEQVSVWLLTLKLMLDLEEMTQERLYLARLIVSKGVSWIKGSQVESNGGFISSFREIALDEVRLSLIVGRQPNLSLSDYKACIGSPSPAPIPSIPSDLSFISALPRSHKKFENSLSISKADGLTSLNQFILNWNIFSPTHRRTSFQLPFSIAGNVWRRS